MTGPVVVSLCCVALSAVMSLWQLRRLLRQRRLQREIAAGQEDRDRHGCSLWRYVRNRKGLVVDMRLVPTQDLVCFTSPKPVAEPEEPASSPTAN